MPRNRKTKGRGTSGVHAKATVPDGDEGHQLESELKAEKIQTMISDFDMEVARRVKELKKDVPILISKLKLLYSVEILKIPKHIREMKLSEFLASGGAINDSVAEEVEDTIEHMALSARIDKVSKGKKTGLQQPGSTKKRLKNPPRGKPPTSVRNTGGRTLRRTRQKVMETPANQGIADRLGWETPLFTPKFDPRLPITPAMGRRPRPGEVTISVSGSPVRQPAGATIGPELILPVGNDQLMSITAETALDQLQIPDMNEEMMQSLHSLQSTLSRLLMPNLRK